MKVSNGNKSFFAIVVVASLITGCGGYRYRYNTGLPAGDRTVTQTQNQFLWGYVNDAPFDLGKACPEGVARFGSHVSFADWVPSFLTLGIYTPRTVEATCAKAEHP